LDPESTTRKFRADSISLDSDVAITETAEYLSVEPVTIAREGVFPYDDGRAYKPADELRKGADVARTYLAWDHPPLKVITKPAEIKGFAENVHFVKDGAGSRVKSRLTFLKKRLTQDQQELIRSKVRRDVSVGFYYEEDRTPGTWGGQQYDYVQKNFVFDHVASVDHGRCAYPNCGIGVDVGNNQGVHIGNDPYPNEHACRMADPDKMAPNSFRRVVRGKLALIIAKLKGERTTTLQAFRYPKSKWTEAAARAHCQKAGGSFEAATGDQGNSVMKSETDLIWPGGEGRLKQLDVNYRTAEPDAERCGECVFFRRGTNICSVVEGQVSENMVCDEFTGRGTIEQMVQSYRSNNSADPTIDQLTSEQRNRIPKSEFAYAPSENRSEWKLPIANHDLVVAGLQALQGARGGVKIPAGNLAAVKRKICAAARKFDVKSAYCGTADSAEELMRNFMAMDRVSLVDFHRFMHHADDFTEESMLHGCLLYVLRKKR
jgi:hypothetical protein